MTGDELVSRKQFFFKNFKHGLRRNGKNIITFVILVSTFAAIIIAINGNAKVRNHQLQIQRLIQCQNAYNEANNARTRALSDAAEAETQAASAVDDAFRDLIEAKLDKVSEASLMPIRARLKEALDRQAAARKRTLAERVANPVPPPPNAFCGVQQTISLR